MTLKLNIFVVAIAVASVFSPAKADDLDSMVKKYTQESKVAPSPANGELFFSNKHGKDWSCSSCHGMPPISEGKHVVTKKPIKPMAPAFNPERFTDNAKVEKWFKRNCNDVLGRECVAFEKADVLAYLSSIKK